MSDWTPPRCPHGHIILGCPEDDCPEQTIYLHEIDLAMRDWMNRVREDVRAIFQRTAGA